MGLINYAPSLLHIMIRCRELTTSNYLKQWWHSPRIHTPSWTRWVNDAMNGIKWNDDNMPKHTNIIHRQWIYFNDALKSRWINICTENIIIFYTSIYFFFVCVLFYLNAIDNTNQSPFRWLGARLWYCIEVQLRKTIELINNPVTVYLKGRQSHIHRGNSP